MGHARQSPAAAIPRAGAAPRQMGAGQRHSPIQRRQRTGSAGVGHFIRGMGERSRRHGRGGARRLFRQGIVRSLGRCRRCLGESRSRQPRPLGSQSLRPLSVQRACAAGEHRRPRPRSHLHFRNTLRRKERCGLQDRCRPCRGDQGRLVAADPRISRNRLLCLCGGRLERISHSAPSITRRRSPCSASNKTMPGVARGVTPPGSRARRRRHIARQARRAARRAAATARCCPSCRAGR